LIVNGLVCSKLINKVATMIKIPPFAMLVYTKAVEGVGSKKRRIVRLIFNLHTFNLG